MQEVPAQTPIAVPEWWHRARQGAGVGVTGVGVTQAEHHQGGGAGHQQPPRCSACYPNTHSVHEKSYHQLRARGEPGPPLPPLPVRITDVTESAGLSRTCHSVSTPSDLGITAFVYTA